MNDDHDLAQALLAAPAGVALLQSLEVECRPDVYWWESPDDSRPAAVEAAVDLVGEMTFGRLAQRAVAAADRIAGPWMPSAPTDLSNAYRLASAHRPIADAIVERFADRLRAPFDGEAQEWWSTAPRDVTGAWEVRPWDHDEVYCCGEFSFGGLFTVTRPADELHLELIEMWELYPRPIGRWALPLRMDARVHEIHGVDDWIHLVEAYPRRPVVGHSGWELPGPNQHLAEIAGIELASGGRAARNGVTIAMPDWERVATDFDGVHLSWMGMLATEGHVTEVPALGAGTATMLRYWRSERTLWLRDVFGEPEPLPAPFVLDDEDDPDDPMAIDVRHDPDRRAADRRLLSRRLGSDPV